MSSATIDEPSLTTATGMATRTSGGVELEHDAADLDVVARLEPCALERGDHAHPAQAALDVGQRLLVLEVVARDQALDGVAADAEVAVRPTRSTSNAAPRGRAEDPELGHVVLAGALGHRLGDAARARSSSRAQLVEPLRRWRWR